MNSNDGPQLPPVKMFKFTDQDDYQVVIFARGYWKAKSMHDALRHNLGYMPRGWWGNEWDTWLEWGEEEHLEQMLATGEEGIGVYVPHDGWYCLPMPKELW